MAASDFRRALYVELRGLVQATFTDARVYALGSTPTKGTPSRYATWNRVSAVHERHLTAGAGLVAERYEINVWARRLADGEKIADTLTQRLDNYDGQIGDAENRATVAAVFLDGDAHTFEPPTDGSGAGWHRLRLDFLFWHAEPASPIR